MQEFNEPTIETPLQKLDKQLKAAGIDTSTWGTGKAKTLKDLQREIEEKETILDTDEKGLVRRTRVGGVDILYVSPEGKLYRLREDRQVFKDGRERRRDHGHAVAGKLKAGEVPREAMIREIREELSITGEIVPIQLYVNDEELISSPSYPGLRTQSFLYKYEAELTGDQFKPEGYKETEAKTGLTTYFVWEEMK